MNTPGLPSLLHSQVSPVTWSRDFRMGVAVSLRCEASIRNHAFLFSQELGDKFNAATLLSLAQKREELALFHQL